MNALRLHFLCGKEPLYSTAPVPLPEVPDASFDEWQGRFWKARGAAKKAISPGAPEPRMKPGFWQRVQYFLSFLPCFPAMFVTFLQRNLLASCLAALAARKPHISNSFWENKLSLRMKVLFLSSLSPAPPCSPQTSPTDAPRPERFQLLWQEPQ